MVRRSTGSCGSPLDALGKDEGPSMQEVVEAIRELRRAHNSYKANRRKKTFRLWVTHALALLRERKEHSLSRKGEKI
jgi:hypothetical protein